MKEQKKRQIDTVETKLQGTALEERIKMWAESHQVEVAKIKAQSMQTKFEPDICCFFGSRSLPTEKKERELMGRLGAKIWEAIDLGYSNFLTSAEDGFNLLAAEMVFFYKNLPLLKDELKLEVAIPYNHNLNDYHGLYKERCVFLLDRTDRISLIEDHRPLEAIEKEPEIPLHEYLLSKATLIITDYPQQGTPESEILNALNDTPKTIWYI